MTPQEILLKQVQLNLCLAGRCSAGFTGKCSSTYGTENFSDLDSIYFAEENNGSAHFVILAACISRIYSITKNWDQSYYAQSYYVGKYILKGEFKYFSIL